jgi:chromosome segregation ATPase
MSRQRIRNTTTNHTSTSTPLSPPNGTPPNRHPDLHEADQQIFKGMELIRQTYETQTSFLYNEMTKYKKESMNQKQQIQHLQNELGRVSRLLAHTERELATEKAERLSLAATNEKLEEELIRLRKLVTQLDSIRKVDERLYTL